MSRINSGRKGCFFVTLIITAGICIGTAYTVLNKLNTPIKRNEPAKTVSQQKEIKKENKNNNKPVFKYDNKAELNMLITYSCGHNETKINPIPESFIGKTIDEIKMSNPDYNIYKYDNFVIYGKENINESCGNHYYIVLKGNKLISFNTKAPDTIVKETSVDTSEYSKEDLDILKKGIEVTSKNELLEFFEGFIV